MPLRVGHRRGTRMKRDMELVRLILLKVEAEGTHPVGVMDDFQLEGYPDETVSYHVWLLEQAGFLEALDMSSMDGFHYWPRCLTWAGTEFVDSIRDPEAWRRAKEGAARAGGAGVELLWEIAKGIARGKAKELLGVDI